MCVCAVLLGAATCSSSPTTSGHAQWKRGSGGGAAPSGVCCARLSPRVCVLGVGVSKAKEVRVCVCVCVTRRLMNRGESKVHTTAPCC